MMHADNVSVINTEESRNSRLDNPAELLQKLISLPVTPICPLLQTPTKTNWQPLWSPSG